MPEMTTHKVLLLGKTGMLGKELAILFGNDSAYTLTSWTHDEVDVTDFQLLEKKIQELQPSIIINAVAYNAVDLCEDTVIEKNKAFTLNRDVPKKLAQISKSLDATLVHYSTDYVFGSNEKKDGGFVETDIPIPNSVYGMSKYEGELQVQDEGGKYYCIRLSRLFGEQATSTGKKSFFEVMSSLAVNKKELNVVDDEISCFTYAPDLALATKGIIESKKEWGIYHIINEGEASWLEGLRTYFTLAAITTILLPVAGASFNRKAKRPLYSVLANTKYDKQRNYKEAIIEFLKKTNKK
jgi:dTDP-4-dehydrorhamnose reductase